MKTMILLVHYVEERRPKHANKDSIKIKMGCQEYRGGEEKVEQILGNFGEKKLYAIQWKWKKRRKMMQTADLWSE
ncbi:hypothetical protein Fmac_027666 [Flemingia macrophylla]|uniref:Uncharacterized protein n=1 Tax=Flemingia macrophylla TaxID=520843 RepID=A0ABD1LIE0_9FABA